jgi:hypothetical protein
MANSNNKTMAMAIINLINTIMKWIKILMNTMMTMEEIWIMVWLSSIMMRLKLKIQGLLRVRNSIPRKVREEVAITMQKSMIKKVHKMILVRQI